MKEIKPEDIKEMSESELHNYKLNQLSRKVKEQMVYTKLTF